MGFGAYAVLACDKGVAEHMVQVEVRVQKPLDRKAVFLEIIGKGGLFAGIRGARVDEDGFARIVAQNESVDSKWVKYERFECHMG